MSTIKTGLAFDRDITHKGLCLKDSWGKIQLEKWEGDNSYSKGNSYSDRRAGADEDTAGKT